MANSRKPVDADYAAAVAAGATDKGAPEIRLCYDPRYDAANVADPDDYSIEFGLQEVAVLRTGTRALRWLKIQF